jgi:thymidylate synthase ThyX
MQDVQDLSHTVVPLSGGGEVFVLNSGAVIGPESQAMLGALHSRSPGGIRSHLKMLAEKGSDKFMSTFYVGYGHKSIGDLGNTSVFIEGVSMLVAKAIQDFPLYNGQEVSTRYVDFSKQRFVDPVGTEQSGAILEEWRSFYLSGLEELIPVLKERYPRGEGEDEKVWEKAVKARAFDTMRAFLPSGASTNLVWTGELRQFADRIPVLRHHPLPEVREVGEAIEKALLIAFPNSFSAKRYDATEAYLAETQEEYAYFDEENPGDFKFTDSINHARLAEYRKALTARPPKTELPYAVRDAGVAEFKFLLDFGSFRDIQRHRAVSLRMPIITERHGFESWYLSELPNALRKRAEQTIATQLAAVNACGLSETQKQYYLPMGFRTAVRFTGDLRALVYLVEIRATRFVHPTLRVRAVQMAQKLVEAYGKDGLVLHLDPEPDRFDIKRGTHDIVSKE